MKSSINYPASAGSPFISLARDIAQTILEIIARGWRLALESPDVSVGSGEVTITERLRDAMRKVVNSDEVGWKGKMIVAPGAESRSSMKLRAPDGRTDIPIYVIGIYADTLDHDPQAIIECKRIGGSDARLCREYVTEGVDRFRSGKYGRNHSTGFMVGYLISGSAQAAATRINGYLNHKFHRTEKLVRSNFVSGFYTWRSSHPRADGRSIELHHAFLPVEQFA